MAMIVSLDQYRDSGASSESPSSAFRMFMANLDKQVLKGRSPWKGIRDRSIGRDFRW